MDKPGQPVPFKFDPNRKARSKPLPKKVTPLISLMRRCDVILEIADARFSGLSRNQNLEMRAKKEGRRLFIVFNKIDAISPEFLEELRRKHPQAFFVSGRKRIGIGDIRKFLIQLSRSQPRDTTVGIVGFPNTGKSTIINLLKGSHSAGTSPVAGFTRSMQKLRIHPKIMLWDTPGVTPYGSDETMLAILGAKNPQQLKDPEGVALRIINSVRKATPGMLKLRYGVDESLEPDAILEAITKRTGALKKGAELDVERAAITVIHDWQKDRLRKL